MSSPQQIRTTKLSDGSEIPVLGFGTGTPWMKSDRFAAANPEMVRLVKEAIAAGYRHFDGAEAYGTEKELGQAIAESGVPREEFFIVSKISNTIEEGSPEDVTAGLDNSLKRMGLDYLDLYYLHTPYASKQTYVEADVAKEWKLMEDLQRSGKVRALGISDCRKQHIENLFKTAEIKPVACQIQFNPYIEGAPQYAKWLQSQGIACSSYMGLAPITHLKGNHLDETLDDLAKKYGVEKSTILIRWQLNLGILVVNTTTKPERFKEYFAALDIELSQEDQDLITSIGQSKHLRIPLPPLYDGGEHGPYEY